MITIRLVSKSGETCKVDEHHEGVSLSPGGSDVADMYVLQGNVTIYITTAHRIASRALENKKTVDRLKEWKKHGIMAINGLKAKDTMDELLVMAHLLNEQPKGEFWEINETTSGHKLDIMLIWAHNHPDCRWVVQS